MKITFEQVLSESDWLQKEMLISLPFEVIDKASKDQFYDVKLLINDVEVEPKAFNDIMNKIEEYIDREARILVNEKLNEADLKVRKLVDMIETASGNIIDEFNLDKHNY